MSDWQIGDLAVCVDDGRRSCPHSRWMTHGGGNVPRVGSVKRIAALYPNQGDKFGLKCGCTAIVFEDGSSGADFRFRKIRPDEREACEPEFITLLKRSKRKVEA